MLYDQWRQIVREKAEHWALLEIASGRQWSFSEIDHLVTSRKRTAAGITFPQGHNAEYIFSVLQAWRDRSVVCSLEIDEKPPTVSVPPPPCIHLKTTSATTGDARFIAFTAGQLAADANNIVCTMGLRPDWPNLGVISLAHSYGFSNLVLPLLLHGIPLIIVPSPLPEALRRVAKIKPSLTLAAVPALWRTWFAAEAIPLNIRLAISAGAPLPLPLERAVFEKTGIKIHNFYGASECGGIAYDSTETPRVDDACVGTPMQNVELGLSEDLCIKVSSRAVGECYWPKAEISLQRGCFQTSDLAEFRHGAVNLRGRLTDQINVAGRKVSPAIIERVLLEHESVSECLVFGLPIPGADRTETIVACIATKAPATAEGLKQFLLNKLPAWQLPREWWFVESLTRNRRGKVSRHEWRERFLAARQSP